MVVAVFGACYFPMKKNRFSDLFGISDLGPAFSPRKNRGNPCGFKLGPMDILGHSGQPVKVNLGPVGLTNIRGYSKKTGVYLQGLGLMSLFGDFQHHLQISVGYYIIPNSRVMLGHLPTPD